ncbi:peptide-methionine (S)-S-oxide reductase [Shigella flexneri]
MNGRRYRITISLRDLYQSDSQRVQALASVEQYQQAMNESQDSRRSSLHGGHPPSRPFYVAEDYHQQYLDKNPEGYCSLGGSRCLSAAFFAEN